MRALQGKKEKGILWDGTLCLLLIKKRRRVMGDAWGRPMIPMSNAGCDDGKREAKF